MQASYSCSIFDKDIRTFCRINNIQTLQTIYNTNNTETYDRKRTQDIIHFVALMMLTDIRTFNRSNNIYRRSYVLSYKNMQIIYIE